MASADRVWRWRSFLRERFGAGNDAHEHFVKLSGLDRLGQATGERRAGELRLIGTNAHRSEQDQGHRFDAGQLADFAREHDAIHARHLHVQNRQVEAFRRRAAIPGPARPLWAPRGIMPHLRGLHGQNAAVGRVVVHDQQAQIGQLRLAVLPARTAALSGAACSGRVKWKVEPFCGHAFDPHFAAHQFDQPLADGEAEAGAAVMARGRSIGLAEGFEQARQPVDGNADAGVANGEMQLPGFGCRLLRPGAERTLT